MGTRIIHRRYNRELGLALCMYVILLVGAVTALRTLDGTVARAAVTLLPVLPVVLMIRAMVRLIRAQDELERRIVLEAIAVSTAATGAGFFTFGMLLNAEVIPAPAPAGVAIWVLPVLMFVFGVTRCVVSWRYRQP